MPPPHAFATIIKFAAPAPLLNLNDRMHHMKKAALVRQWREAAQVAACSLGPPSKRAHPPSLVRVTLPVKSLSTRRDPHNFVATVKPIIDGLVQAGVWPDDTAEWVSVLEPAFHVSQIPGRFNTRQIVLVTIRCLHRAHATE